MRPDPPAPENDNPEQGRPSTTAPPYGAPDRTVVHLVRHGEVHNPDGVALRPAAGVRPVRRTVGRWPCWSPNSLAGHDVVHLRCSPLERAQQTMEPIAAEHDAAKVVIDGRVIEADNRLEGQQVRFPQTLRRPSNLWLLRNPLRPSWGETYTEIVARMRLAIADAAAAAAGHEAVIVSHQLPIWMARCDVEGRRLVHDPRRRECALASVTSLTLIDGRVTSVVYSEPAAASDRRQGQQEVRRRCLSSLEPGLRRARSPDLLGIVGSARPVAPEQNARNPSRSRPAYELAVGAGRRW